MDDCPRDVIRLLRLAQAGQAEQALAQADANLGVRQDLGMLYARAVALRFLGEHERSVATAELMLALVEGPPAAVAGSISTEPAEPNITAAWRTIALSFRACQLMLLSEIEPQAIDLEATLHDLAEAEASLSDDVANSFVLATAHTGIGHGYHQLRLYELAQPHYQAAFDAATNRPDEVDSETAAKSQLNLAELHLNWSVELHRIRETAAARDQRAIAATHAATAQRYTYPDTPSYATYAAVFAACADVSGDDARVAEQIRAGLQAAEGQASRDLPAFALPFLAWALDRAGSTGDALEVAAQACAALPQDATWLLASAAYHTRASLLARSGSESDEAGLAYGDRLAKAMWRQRLRTLHNARSMQYLERVTQERDRVQVLAHTDALTGVGNRRAFDVRVEDLNQLAADSTEIAMIIVDVDGLKAVNDAGGHEAGDVTLQAVALALSGQVSAHDLVARVGGDEFVVVVEGMDRDAATALAQRLLEAVAAMLDNTVTVSIGVATGSPAEAGPVLLRTADRAMYEAKRTGQAAVISGG